MSVTLGETLKNINETKNLNLLLEDDSGYLPFIVNRCLSMHRDAIMYVNFMNQFHQLPKRMQHDFLLLTLRKTKRFAKFPKKENTELVGLIMEYFNISEAKAQELEPILLGKEPEIMAELFKGGKKNAK